MYERMNIEDWKAKKKNDRDAVLADQKYPKSFLPKQRNMRSKTLT